MTHRKAPIGEHGDPSRGTAASRPSGSALGTLGGDDVAAGDGP
jgi:hypothetical protein